MIKMTERERLSYVAGFIEGEGCINIIKRKRGSKYYLKISVGNTDFSLLKSIRRDLKIGRVESKTNGTNFKNYSYSASHCKALEVLKKVFPFLRAKKKEALLGIKFQEQMTKEKYVRRRPVPRKIGIKRENMFLKMKLLRNIRRQIK